MDVTTSWAVSIVGSSSKSLSVAGLGCHMHRRKRYLVNLELFTANTASFLGLSCEFVILFAFILYILCMLLACTLTIIIPNIGFLNCR